MDMNKPKAEVGRKLKHQELAQLTRVNTVIEIPFEGKEQAVSIATAARQYAKRNGFTVETVRVSEKKIVWVKRVS